MLHSLLAFNEEFIIGNLVSHTMCGDFIIPFTYWKNSQTYFQIFNFRQFVFAFGFGEKKNPHVQK